MKTRNSRNTCVAAFVALSLLTFGVQARADIALMDIGRAGTASPAAENINNIIFDHVNPVRAMDSGVIGLINSAGQATGWSVQISGSQILAAGGGADIVNLVLTGDALDLANTYHVNAWKDSIATYDDVVVSLTGLDDAELYNLQFFGSRLNRDVNMVWSITKGSGGADVTYGSLNTSEVVDWSNISTDGNGEIEVTLSLDGFIAGNQTIGAMNFASIEVVPEPGTIGLSLVGVGALFLFRRKFI